MGKIYASIKTIGERILIEPTDHDKIYERMMEITDNDHEISSDAASWCELATVGEEYGFREGTIVIVEL